MSMGYRWDAVVIGTDPLAMRNAWQLKQSK